MNFTDFKIISRKIGYLKFIFILLIGLSFSLSIFLYFQIDKTVTKNDRFDIRKDDICKTSKQNNWKWGSRKDNVEEEKRIRDSLAVELDDIAKKRDEARIIHQRLISNNSKLEETIHDLELLIKELKLKKKEYSDLRNVKLTLPHQPLLPKNENTSLNLYLNQSFTIFELAVDYSRCSITKKFLYFLYNLDENEKDYVALNLQNELSTNPAGTTDEKLACLFIGIVTKQFDPQRYQFFNNVGRNHVFIVLNQLPVDISLLKASMVVNSMFGPRKFRKGMDISCFLRIPAAHVDEWKRLTPILPHNRKVLVSFVSGKNGITEEVKKDVTNMEKFMKDSKDDGKFVLDCAEAMPTTEIMPLCGTKQERSKLLQNSVFVILFADIPSFQQRLYESMENGAIPVILSMTTSLPFDEFIDWNQAVIRIPLSRFPELHYILRSISLSDQLEMKRKGRFYMENYLLNTKKLIQTILGTFRFRLQISTTFSNEIQAKPLFDGSFTSIELVPITRPLIMPENLGPVESPTPSEMFIHNFTTFGLYSSKIWNNYPYFIQNTPDFLMDDAILPSESEFYEETNSGMRPISPGSGQAFSEALGGNRPNEQFTIVIVTYNRDNVLYLQLENFQQLPFLNKIVIIWNNIDREPPKIWPKLHVPIYFVKAKRNSLNNRFLPLNIIETEAVLSLDDDMDLKQAEIILAFRIWRQERTKIIGFPARYHARFGDSMFYNSNHTCQYSMILTGAAFIHKSYFYAYTYNLPEVIHNKIDELMNCEDIAMNFLVAHLTRQPPIKTTSKWTIRCPSCEENLSNDPQHFDERHECIRFFTKVFGYNPLVFSQYRADSVLFKTRVPQNCEKCFMVV